MVNTLPQITNEAEMKDALSGDKALYAVLDAPVTGSPVDDVSDILTEDYMYILYLSESLEASIYYPEGLGAETTYSWESSDDTREAMSSETYLYNDIPIDLTDCLVENADGLSSERQIKPLKKTKAYVDLNENYYYPDSMIEDPDDPGKSYGLKRYEVRFLKSGTSLSFLAWVGDDEISVYESYDGDAALATVVQHGKLSNLLWIFESNDVGNAILLWIVVLFLIMVIPLVAFYIEENRQPVETGKKKGSKKKAKIIPPIEKTPANGFHAVLQGFLILIPYRSVEEVAKAIPHKDCTSDAPSDFSSNETKSGANTLCIHEHFCEI